MAVWAILALSVSLRSGYSVGAVVLLAVGLWCWPALLRREVALPRAMALWALSILVMALVWSMHIVEDGRFITSTLGADRMVKYWLVLLLLPALLVRSPAVWALFWGCVLGAVGAGLTALWQTAGLDWPRAQGYTNAIQFGNLALLLGLWCGVWALHVPAGRRRVVAWLAAGMGLLASIASGTRGGWVVLPPCLLLILWFTLGRPGRGAADRLARSLGLTLVICVPLAFLSPVQERVHEAVTQYWSSSTASEGTSVGLRLAEWEFAWQRGVRHPWLGVGQKGYEADQRKAVASGESPPEMLKLNHAHNEWLDMFAKRGVIGVVGLLVFFGLPLALFWRALGRLSREAAARPSRRAAALCGLVTVLGFFGFGMTQVMFAHNNGNLMYLLSVSVWLAACTGDQRHPFDRSLHGHD
ncbi:MAG: O-antigen ligase family protein [Comamonas sp.]